LEAVLFVGHPNNEPLTSHQIATLMRGVRPSEVDQLVRDLNRQYAEEGCPYCVESIGSGYRLVLRPQYDSWRSRFYGKIRQARLSQAAIDVLAIVAYRQPVQRGEIDKLRGKPSGAILSQLVRRKLLRIEGRDGPQRMPLYRTTDRFLALFELDSLDELPRGQEPDALV
jgi:segregation and condensation protein B